MSTASLIAFFVFLPFIFRADSAACERRVPSVGGSGCHHYDLSPLADTKYTFRKESHSYVVSLCGNVPTPPAPCKSKPPSPAYWYTESSCYVLGMLNDTLTYPVDPEMRDRGVRIVYGGGETSDSVERAAIMDVFCDSMVTGASILETAYEWPGLAYKFTFYSSYACPISQNQSERCPSTPYHNSWRSLAFRPVPSWFDDVKFGIFVVWGLYSVPAFGSEWYWHNLMTGSPSVVQFHNRVYGCSGVMPDKYPCTGPKFTYEQFAEMFKAELFDPDQWAKIFQESGAKYVVYTAKFHDGYCLYPSPQHWNWNSVDVGPHRDLVGDLTTSVRAAGLRMGYYHSLREWYHPLYVADQKNNCSTTDFVDEIIQPTMKDIVMKYKPDIIWSDGSGDAPCTHDSVKYWKAPDFISWLYNHSPVNSTVLVNSRWGTGAGGDYTTGPDRYTPLSLVLEKWESAYTIQEHSWGYDRREDVSLFYNTTHLIYQLVSTVACNGNLLLDVGPTHDGRILPLFEERLKEMGQWLKINGEAIYKTTPFTVAYDDKAKQIWYTSPKTQSGRRNSTTVYAISFVWPETGILVLTQVAAGSDLTVNLLGYEKTLTYQQLQDGLHINLPSLDINETPSLISWVFKLHNIRSHSASKHGAPATTPLEEL